MITLNKISLQRGQNLLLEDSSLTIFSGKRVALIGRNGCGKSSIFQLLLGNIDIESGEIEFPSNLRIAHMAQEVDHSNRSALDYVQDSHKKLRSLQKQIQQCEETGDHNRLGSLYEQMDSIDGFAAEHTAAELLNGLGFDQSEFQKPTIEFSGGWRIRLNLAQALMTPSDLMLLDEPTNHLDVDTTYWLEQRLKRYQGTLVLISHDRDFIDNIAHEIVHVENSQLHSYKGNYSAFERQRAEKLALQQSMYSKQQAKIKHLQSFITRFKAKASKAKQAQSRVKQLENMEVIASSQIDSPFHFEFTEPAKTSNPLLYARECDLGYDTSHTNSGESTHLVIVKAQFNLAPGDRIGLLGVNGAGKSTFIKTLTGSLQPLNGQIFWGDNTKIGYFAQHQLESLDPQANAMLHIQRISPDASEQKIRQFLGGFNFHGNRATEAIAPFSGGEKARLALACIVWQKPNVLLLDEPTNHLDLDMRSALTLALQSFSGALIVVSHDRHLLRHSVDQYWLIHQAKLAEFKGTLDDYYQFMSSGKTTEDAKLPEKSKVPSSASQQKNASSLNKKEQRQQAAADRQQTASITKRIKIIEEKMQRAQSQLTNIEIELSDTDLYTDKRKDDMSELLFKQAEISRELGVHEELWLELQDSLEN